MIVQTPTTDHSGQPIKAFWLALMFVRELAEWRLQGQPHDTQLDAGRACAREFQKSWLDIEERVRHLRALCEHPEIAGFMGEGIDGEMLSTAARRLHESIEWQHPNVLKLLEEPEPDDLISIDGVQYRVSPNTGQLELAVVASVELASPADTAFLQGVVQLASRIRESTGDDVSAQGIDETAITLLLMHPELERTGDTVEQISADRLFSRLMAAAVRRAHERTGKLVSPSALKDGVRFARKVRDDMARRLASEVEPIEEAVTPVFGVPVLREDANVIPFPDTTDDDEDRR